MAQVTRVADDQFTLNLNNKESTLVKRWGDEQVPTRTRAQQLEDVIKGFLQNKANDYRLIDGPTLRDKYEALTPEQRAAVDAILG